MKGDDGMKAGDRVTTFVYDSSARGAQGTDHAAIDYIGADGFTVAYGDAGAAVPASDAPVVPRPALRHTFEFRLSGSETQEQCWPGDGPSTGRVAIERMRAYLTRAGEPVAVPGAIAGLEVHAERREPGIVCIAQLSDFAAGDLVVVQVELAVFGMS